MIETSTQTRQTWEYDASKGTVVQHQATRKVESYTKAIAWCKAKGLVLSYKGWLRLQGYDAVIARKRQGGPCGSLWTPWARKQRKAARAAG